MSSRKKHKYKEAELIAMIQQGSESDSFREAADYLYCDLKQKAERTLLNNNTMVRNSDDAEEIYHRAFIDFLVNIQSGRFRGEGKLTSYFWGILEFTKIKWLKEQQVEVTMELPEIPEDDAPAPDIILITEEEYEILQQLLSQLSEKCRELLLWDKKIWNSEEMAAKLDYASKEVLHVSYWRCWQRFIALLDN